MRCLATLALLCSCSVGEAFFKGGTVQEYLELVRYVLENGAKKTDRTGTGTLSLFGLQTRYDLRKGFPLLTTKKVLFDAVVRELLWFLRGSTNIHDGLTQYTPIWNPWADAQGELGPIYGYQWRQWPRYTLDERTGQYSQGHIDQLQQVIDSIKRDPHSRRLIVSAWNVADLDQMALPPCHLLMQFYVIDNRLDLQVYQRSADLALGVPFNTASYALLLMMVAQECALQPGCFIHTLGDAHIYLNHIEGLTRQLQRTPYPLPRLTIAPKPLFDLTFEDICLSDYVHHPFIKFPIAV
jgi:thymidylate synthase